MGPVPFRRPDGKATKSRFSCYQGEHRLSWAGQLPGAALSGKGTTIWRVGACTVDPATNEVSRSGEVVHLEPRSMEVLCLLIRHAGQVVPRDELLTAVWGEVVVGDESLTSAIIKIRKALGDDARDPRFVETIPKRGYRLIAAVAPARAGRRRKGTFLAIGAIGVVGMAALVLLAWAWFPTDMLRRGVDVAPERPGASAPAAPSVGVRPFKLIGARPGLDYLARGIEETVINRLGAMPDLVLTHLPRGAETQPDFVLEGVVRVAEAGLSASFRILDGRSGAILASERIAPPLPDPLALERAVERRVLAALAHDIARADLSRRARGYTDSAAAFDLFLQGQAALLARTEAGNRRARRLYRAAIGHDPRFARAYGGLALTLAADYRNGWADDPQAALSGALKMARTALEIAPELPEQHWVIGYVRTQQRRFPEARAALHAALRLRPGYADAHALLGGIATYAGKPQESVPLLREAIRLRPAAGYLYYLLLGRAYYFLDECEQAEINLTEALSRNPENVEARLYHAACLVRAGLVDEAAWQVEEVRAIGPGLSLDRFFSSYPMTDRGQITRLRRDLVRAGFM